MLRPDILRMDNRLRGDNRSQQPPGHDPGNGLGPEGITGVIGCGKAIALYVRGIQPGQQSAHTEHDKGQAVDPGGGQQARPYAQQGTDDVAALASQAAHQISGGQNAHRQTQVENTHGQGRQVRAAGHLLADQTAERYYQSRIGPAQCLHSRKNKGVAAAWIGVRGHGWSRYITLFY